jgi:thioredoxin 1
MGEPRGRTAGVAALCAITLFVAAVLLAVPAVGADSEAAARKHAAPLPRLVDVGADKCIPCIMMAPVLEELKKEYAGVLNVEFVDAWKNPSEARKYKVRGIPTQIFYDASGKELGRHLGFISKEDILKTFEELKVPLKKKPAGK